MFMHAARFRSTAGLEASHILVRLAQLRAERVQMSKAGIALVEPCTSRARATGAETGMASSSSASSSQSLRGVIPIETPQEILARSIFSAVLLQQRCAVDSDGDGVVEADGEVDGGGATPRVALPKRLRRVLPLLESVILRTASFQDTAGRILARHCPGKIDSTPPQRLPTGLTGAVGRYEGVGLEHEVIQPRQVASSAKTNGSKSRGKVGAHAGQKRPRPAAWIPHAVDRKGPRVSLAQPRRGSVQHADLGDDSPALALDRNQVQIFLVNAITAIVPKSMLGSSPTRRAILARAASLVTLKHHDAVPLRSLLNGIPLNGMKWLHPSHTRRQGPEGAILGAELAQSWIAWILRGLAVPLLRSHFYCTEGDGLKGTLMFYRKCDWARVQSFGIESTVRRLHLRKLGSDGPNHMEGGRSNRGTNPMSAPPPQSGPDVFALPAPPLGLAAMRLVPKRIGWRPVANLANKRAIPAAALTRDAAAAVRRLGAGHSLDWSRQTAKQRQRSGRGVTTMSINAQLRHGYEVLTSIRRARPELFGSSVFGYQNVQEALAAARAAFTAGSIETQPRDIRLAAVAADVQGCYDSMQHPLVVDLVSDILREFAGGISGSEASTRMQVAKLDAGAPASSRTPRAVDRVGSPMRRVSKSQNETSKGTAVTVSSRWSLATSTQHPKHADLQAWRQLTEKSQPLEAQVDQTSVAVRAISVIEPDLKGTSEAAPACRVRQRTIAGPVFSHRPLAPSALQIWRSGGLRDGALLSDMPPRWPIQLSRTARDLDSHARAHVVSLGGGLFHQRSGVPQGSVVSTLMCNMYYGRIERLGVLPQLYDAMTRAQRESESRVTALLMRLTDDWLLLTNSQAVADEFRSIVERGYPLAGCACKREKTVVARIDASGIPWVPWCGLSIQCNAGLASRQDLRRLIGAEAADRLSYSRGEQEHDPGAMSFVSPSSSKPPAAVESSTTLSVQMQSSPSAMLRKYADGFVRPWRRGLFLDVHEIGLRDCLLNVGEIACLASAKLIALVRRAPAGVRASVTPLHIREALLHIASVLSTATSAPTASAECWQGAAEAATGFRPTSACAGAASGASGVTGAPVLLCGAHMQWDPVRANLVPRGQLEQSGSEDSQSSQSGTTRQQTTSADYGIMLGASLGVRPGRMEQTWAGEQSKGMGHAQVRSVPASTTSGVPGCSNVTDLMRCVAVCAGESTAAMAPLPAALQARRLIERDTNALIVTCRQRSDRLAIREFGLAIAAVCGGGSDVFARFRRAMAGNKYTSGQDWTQPGDRQGGMGLPGALQWR